MSAEEILRLSEKSALKDSQIVSYVTGAKTKTDHKKRRGGFGVAIFSTTVIAIATIFFSTGNIIPSAISERLIEETDVQYADAVESKILVFQQALSDGKVPANTATRLKNNGVLVGYVQDGEFIETSEAERELSLKIDNEIIPASDFARQIKNNVKLYNAFNTATYSRAAYYYDESANKVFERLGISRNSYTGEEGFEEVMTKALGEGSAIEVNEVGLYEKRRTLSNGEEEIYYDYEEVGTNSNSKNSASDFVESISSRSEAKNEIQATLNAASSINIADTISKEQRASIFFVTFMENISKMKAGYGNNSRINEAMNYLYKNEEVEIVDVKTGEMIKVEGSMLESPSLYAVLSGEKVDIQKVENYSSDRILKTIENQLGENDVSSAISDSIVSTTGGIRGSIGRLIEWGESAINGVLAKIIPTIDNSLVNNSFNSIKGVSGGELLVEGAVNVGKELAKASGATAGDAAAVKSYAKLTNSILALDAEADRLNRSPFDITSKNTFLGSIVYKFAISMTKNGTILNKLAILPRVTIGMFNNLMPVTYANDEAESYLSNFGNCETLGNIGAVGSAGCTMAATFDTSTLNDIYNDAGFINFVATNTILENGVRKVKNNSMLADFILYNNERITPVGVVDGGILESLTKKYSTIAFVNNILDMVKTSLNVDEDQKKIASGEMFVNSKINQEWENYKYAQRYVSLARAQESLRQFDGNETAYSDLKYFEGTENPVVAFLNDYKLIANN